MRGLVLVIGMVAMGCEKEEPEPDYTLRDGYVDALCRFYVPGECADNASATCGASITFDTEADCAAFLRLGLSGCSGYNDVLLANEALVEGCIDELETFDCVNGEVCTETGDVMTSGDCGEVDALIQPLCPEDEER